MTSPTKRTQTNDKIILQLPFNHRKLIKYLIRQGAAYALGKQTKIPIDKNVKFVQMSKL